MAAIGMRPGKGLRRVAASDGPAADAVLIPSLFPLPHDPALPELLALRSSSGTVVYTNERGRLVTSAERTDGGASPALAIRMPARPEFVFLLSTDAAAPVIDMDHDPQRGAVLSYLVVPAPTDGRVFLRHPACENFVCAAPGDEFEMELTCNREEPSGWEEFELAPLDGRLGPRTQRQVAAIGRMLDAGLADAALVSWLQTESDATIGAVAMALLRLCDAAVLGRIGLAAATTPALLGRLASIFPDDSWFTVALRGLAAWLPLRPQATQLAIGTELDFLPFECAIHSGAWSTGARIVTQARRHVEPRRRLAILATARNEGLYFLEFVAHYRALGADHLFIYSNNNNDDSDALLGALADAGVITWIDNRFEPALDGQLKAYSHYFSVLPNGLDYEWTLTVDLDEFVVLDTERHASLPDFLDARRAGGANAVALSWMVFTPSGKARWEPVPLIGRLDRREPEDNWAVKTAVVTRDAVSSYPHDPRFVPGAEMAFVDAVGAPHMWPGREMEPALGPAVYREAWVNHYVLKSAEEYIWKASRNRGGYVLREALQADPETLEPAARWLDADTETDDRARRHLPAVEAELARLRALPGIAAAEAKVIATYQARVAQLRREAGRRLADIADDIPWKGPVARMLARIAAEAGDGDEVPTGA